MNELQSVQRMISQSAMLRIMKSLCTNNFFCSAAQTRQHNAWKLQKYPLQNVGEFWMLNCPQPCGCFEVVFFQEQDDEEFESETLNKSKGGKSAQNAKVSFCCIVKKLFQSIFLEQGVTLQWLQQGLL